MDWVKYLDSIGIIAGAIVAIYGFVKVILPHIRSAFQTVAKFFHDVSNMSKEMQFNGGSSLKDAVVKLTVTAENLSKLVNLLEQRQVTCAQHSDKGIFETNTSGEYTLVNRSFLRLCNRTEDEVLGCSWKNILYEAEKDEIIEEWNSCLQEKRDFIRVMRLVRPDSFSVVVTYHAYVMKDINGKALGWLGFVEPLEVKKPAVNACNP